MAEFTTEDIEKLLAPYGGMANALTMLATRPQKSLVRTNNVSTSTPYALENMIANRDRIGQASARLSDTLRAQENPWFSTIKALGQVQGSTEPGGWLESGLKGFSTGATMLADIKAANDALRLENEMKDLSEILAYDTEMGNKTTSNQTQSTTYEQLPWGGVGGKGKGGASGGVADDVYKGEIAASNLGDLYKTIEDNPNIFSTIGGVHQDEASRALRRGVNTAGVKEMQQREFEYLNNIMPNGFASAINAAKEQENMAPYTTAYKTGTGSSKKAQIKNMLGYIYDVYKLDANRQGFDVPITREQYINSRISAGRAYNPDFYIKSDAPMYKDNGVQPKTRTNTDAMKAFMEGTL